MTTSPEPPQIDRQIPENIESKKKYSRRWALKALVTTLFTGLTGAVTNPAWSHFRAMFSRKSEAVDNKFLSTETYLKLFKKYPELDGIISENQWIYFCQQMSRLINILQSAQPPHSSESFNDTFEQFIDQMYLTTKELGSDFAVISQVAIISAENLDVGDWQQDVKTGARQQLIGAITVLGGKHLLQKAVADREGVANWLFSNSLIKKFITVPEISLYDIIRLDGPVTHTLWDIETELIADSILGTPLEAQLSKKYPEMIVKFRELLELRKQLELSRTELQMQMQEMLRYNPYLLDDFLKPETDNNKQAWAAIGVTSESIDAYHIFNPTFFWKCIVENNIQIKSDVKEFYRSVCEKGISHYQIPSPSQTYYFCSHQILNPKFQKWMNNKVVELEETDIVESWENVKKKLDKYKKLIKNFDVLEADAYRMSCQIEYDAVANAQIGAAFITKLYNRAQTAFQDMIPATTARTKDMSGFMTWATAVGRDIASPDELTTWLFARNTQVDPVYSPDGTLLNAHFLVKTLIESSNTPAPWDDFAAFHKLCRSMQLNQNDPSLHPHLYLIRHILNSRLNSPPYNSFMRAMDISERFTN